MCSPAASWKTAVKGWSRTSGSTTAEYVAGDSFIVTDGMDLYAVWEANTYSVHYYSEGVPCGLDDAVYDVVLNLARVEELGISRTGYAFICSEVLDLVPLMALLL